MIGHLLSRSPSTFYSSEPLRRLRKADSNWTNEERDGAVPALQKLFDCVELEVGTNTLIYMNSIFQSLFTQSRDECLHFKRLSQDFEQSKSVSGAARVTPISDSKDKALTLF